MLIEDSPADIRLLMEACRDSKIPKRLHVANDGLEALNYLFRRGEHHAAVRPDLIILDLNLPIISGHEVLAHVKADDSLRIIPVIVLSTSTSIEDVRKSYELGAACYIRKPLNITEYFDTVEQAADFWLGTAILPSSHRVNAAGKS
ncbi:MAG TPA: response regulator [Bryobacteraceae bacterium]|nr:response regulator [Bryobacteraceae bacterium]